MLFCPLCRIVLGTGEAVCPRDGHSPLEREPQQVPASIAARFAIVEPFADGDSGSLYLVDDRQTGRRGLLKLLRAATTGTVSERGRVRRELMKQATLTHPNLVVPLATGEADNCVWLFREWIDGVSLSVKLARSGALALPEALSIAAQIANALDELHRAGLLMRDLSPGHVITTAQPSGLPKVCLIDAGVTSRIGTISSVEITGKPGYVSPEHARGKLISFRSDLYSLGVLLYEMLSGQPFTRGTAEERLEAQRTQVPPALSVAVPSSLASLIAQLLVKEPRDRPFSAQQVRRTLEPFLPADTNVRREQTAAFVVEDVVRMPVDSKRSGTLRPAPKKATLVGFVVPTPDGANPTPARTATTPEPAASGPRRRQDRTQELSSTELGVWEPMAAPPPFRRDADPTMPLAPTDLGAGVVIRGAPTSPPPPPDAAKPRSASPELAAVINGPSISMAMKSAAQPAPVVAPQPAPLVTPHVQPARVVAPQPAPVVAPQPAPVVTPHVQPAPVVAPHVQPAPVVTPHVQPAPVITPQHSSAQSVSIEDAPHDTLVAAPFDLNHDDISETVPMMREALPRDPGAVSIAVIPTVRISSDQDGPASLGVPAPQARLGGAQSKVTVRGIGIDSEVAAAARQAELEAIAPRMASGEEGGAHPADTRPVAPADVPNVGSAQFPVTSDTAPTAPSQSGGFAQPASVSAMSASMAVERPNPSRVADPEVATAPRRSGPLLVLVGVVGFCVIASGTGIVGTFLWTRFLSPMSAATPVPVAPEPSPSPRVAASQGAVGSEDAVGSEAAAGSHGSVEQASASAAQVTAAGAAAPSPGEATGVLVEANQPEPEPSTPEASELRAEGAPTEPAPTVAPSEPTPSAPLGPAPEATAAPARASDQSAPAPSPQPVAAPRARESGARAQASPGRGPRTPAPAPAGSRTFDQLRDDARAAFQARRFADAARAYEQASSMRPRDAAVWAGLGAARLQGGNARGAVDAYRQAVSIEPRNIRYHVAIGRAFVAAGDRTRARQAFTHALQLDPGNREAQTQLSQL